MLDKTVLSVYILKEAKDVLVAEARKNGMRLAPFAAEILEKEAKKIFRREKKKLLRQMEKL